MTDSINKIYGPSEHNPPKKHELFYPNSMVAVNQELPIMSGSTSGNTMNFNPYQPAVVVNTDVLAPELTIGEIVSRLSEAELDESLKKYEAIIDARFSQVLIKDKKQMAIYSHLINCCYVYIQKNHVDFDSTLKTWCAYVVMNLCGINPHNIKESQILEMIDKFIEYHKANYNNYIQDIEMSESEFFRDLGFVNIYIRNIKK